MNLHSDLRYAWRLLRRAPGFTATAIATLALGIGASTGMFTIVDAVLLRPLPFAEPGRLAMLSPSSGSRLSPEYFREWREQNRTLADMAAWHDERVNVTGAGEPIELLADRVTTNFFHLLGTPPVLGRTFTSRVDLADVAPEVVLSHGLWQRRYGAQPDVLGQPITIDGQRATIVGVMPAGFTIRTTELSESRAEVWLPLPLAPQGTPQGMGGTLHVIARLAAGVTFDQAQADVSAVARRIEASTPSYSRNWTIAVVPLLDATVKNVRLTLLVLFGGVGILLLIACANVAALVLGRAERRRAEIAVRLSLGATTGRLARQFLAENVVLAAIGGAVGFVLATWGTSVLLSSLPPGIELPRTGEIAVNLRILVFAAGVTGLTTLALGFVPLAMAAGGRVGAVLQDAARSLSGGHRRTRVANGLIVSEIALAVILLAGGGLLIRSFVELTNVNPGFRAEQVVTVRMTLSPAAYDSDDDVRAFGAVFLGRLESRPEVVAAGSINYLPMSGFGMADRFQIVGRPEARLEDQKFAWVSVVGGRYFDAMGIPLLRGRVPRETDTQATQPVFVVDETLARRYWPGGNAVGARISWRGGVLRDVEPGTAPAAPGDDVTGEIIGVVGSVHWTGMAANPQPTVYFWFPQRPLREITIVARTGDDPSAVAAAIAADATSIDPNQPVAGMRMMGDIVSANLARPRFTMTVLAGFAGAALLLAVIGIYGVMASAVTQRTREIGLRLALGAPRGNVLRLVMRRALRLTAAGAAIGMMLSMALGRLVESLLFGIPAADPLTLGSVVLLLALAGSLAAYVPGRRATRIDPIAALRAD